jgi:hypothetical protein
MRTKIALLLGVMALVAASVAPAAQGKIVTVKENGVALAPNAAFQGYSTNLVFSMLLGNMSCKWGNEVGKGEPLTTKVTKNKADPALLSGFNGPATCILKGETIVPVTSEATGPVELFGNGTGKLPIKFKVHFPPSTDCTYTGVLSITPTPGKNTASVQGTVTGGTCGYAEIKAFVTFTRENGTAIEFIYS